MDEIRRADEPHQGQQRAYVGPCRPPGRGEVVERHAALPVQSLPESRGSRAGDTNLEVFPVQFREEIEDVLRDAFAERLGRDQEPGRVAPHGLKGIV